jgi:hypothetical protein
MSQINALPKGKQSLEEVLNEDKLDRIMQERDASLKQSFRESPTKRIGKSRNKSVSKVKSKKPSKPKRPRVKKK